MNKPIDQNRAESVFCEIRDDFSSLWSYKLRGATLEIITPFSTMLGNTISVYLTKRDNRFIISDGMWICKLMSEHEIKENKESTIYLNEISQHYGIKTTEKDQAGYCFFFKSTTDIKLLSAYIYDLAFFENAALNSIYGAQTFFQNEDSQWQRFSTRVNNVLNDHILNNSKQNRNFSLEKNRTYTDWRFGAVLCNNSSSHLWFAMYISGSTVGHFSDHICRAIAGFNYVGGRQELKEISHFSIVVDEDSKGYDRNNQTIKATRSQLVDLFHPQIYNLELFRKISDLNDLYQET
jgi:hypothetical protein